MYEPSPIVPEATKGHVLFVSRQRVVGATNGSSAYLLDLAHAVRKAGFTPHLIQPSPDLMGRWPVMRLKSEMDVFESHEIRGVKRLGRWVVAGNLSVTLSALRGVVSRMARRLGLRSPVFADRPRPYAIAARWTEADRAFVQVQAQGRADIVIADYAFQAEALRLLPGRPSAIIMHDLFHARADTDGKGARDSVASLDREREIALLSTADVAIAIQAHEARFVAEHVPGTKALLVPMAAHPVPQPQPGQAGTLLFVGSNTAPNIVALEWLFATVWPLVRIHFPQIRLEVAGSVASAFPGGGPQGVTFHGMVDDLDPLYASAGLVISPLTFGSGLKIKLVEALAKGKAVVATSVTLQGVEWECGPAVILADTPGDFARAIIELQDDAERHVLARAALEAARHHFSPATCHAELIAWLEDNRPRASSPKPSEIAA